MYFLLCNDYLVVKLFWFTVLGRSQIVIPIDTNWLNLSAEKTCFFEVIEEQALEWLSISNESLPSQWWIYSMYYLDL